MSESLKKISDVYNRGFNDGIKHQQIIIDKQAEQLKSLRRFAKYIIDYSDLEKSWVDHIAVRYGLLIEKNDPLKKFYETKLLAGEE